MTASKNRMDLPGPALVRQEIGRWGPLTFAQFMELALYHPVHGYYAGSRQQRGRGGDYFTSPQVSRMFPAAFAKGLAAMREALTAEQFALIEMGAGDGEFLEGALGALDKKAARGLRVWAVEAGRPARERLWRRLSRFARCDVVATLEEVDWMGTVEGCIVSNEFFDALPFHRLRKTAAGVREIRVDFSDGAFIEREGDVSGGCAAALADVPVEHLSEGQEFELRPQVASLYREWGELLSRGYVVTFDYGYPRATLHDPARLSGTWQCFRQHAVSEKPYEFIGEQDITAHVDFTQLARAGRAAGFEPRLFCSQGIFLSYLGKDLFEAYLKEALPAQQRGRASEIQQLVHPDAMGGAFRVLVQTKGIDLPPQFAEIPNRISRL